METNSTMLVKQLHICIVRISYHFWKQCQVFVLNDISHKTHDKEAALLVVGLLMNTLKEIE